MPVPGDGSTLSRALGRRQRLADPLHPGPVDHAAQDLLEARVQRGEKLRVTTRGRAIAELTPPSASGDEAKAAWARLRGSIVRYERPLDPVFGPEEWEMNR